MSSVYQHKTPLHFVRTAARSLLQQGRSDPPIKSRSFRRAATTLEDRSRTGPINICIYSATRRKSRHSRGLAADRGTRAARRSASEEEPRVKTLTDLTPRTAFCLAARN